ncbi:dethiobiotin synthase [Curvibacter sp. RS43]|uniref:dethiobiotin synthase n=1 Tax=Curvibacter microcysteis TaxID=3026419 RepID=UPI00235F258C|nr:dethiobiotin synthase [Curvibacter sp. RS43]MDD0812936.1 dethiobiotin synthase [Curvibacter sp. RS43]
MRAFLITGTDTEIGKTTVTAGLTHLGVQLGLRSVAVKPVAAGLALVDGHWINDDVQRLMAATNLAVSPSQIGPLQLREACAPHIAAHLEGVTLDRTALLGAVQQTLALAELGFVEGVGGFRVPLTVGWDTADMACDLGLPVVLVVGLRLGCINHALLTAEALRTRGLSLAGWVANTVDPAFLHSDLNLDALKSGLHAPCWGHVPLLPNPSPAAVATHLSLNALRQAMEKP